MVGKVYSIDLKTSQYNNYNTAVPVVKSADTKFSPVVNKNQSFGNNISNPAFCASFRTELSSNEEKHMYNQLLNISDKTTRKQLNQLLKNGVLLNNNSNDKSSTLENLYKIASTQRAQGLNSVNILKETVSILADPHVITQQFGNIPTPYHSQVTAITPDADVEHSGTCVASSIEFNLAQKHPAEFARFAQGLSSPQMSVEKIIKLSNLADNTLDAVWLLNAFEVPFEAKDFNEAKLKFAPDKNAIIRAHIQTVDRDRLERSSVDVLMQSTLMQIGSQQSYNSLNDKRAGKFNQNDKGLIEFEKTFTESVVEDKNKISMTYQKVDENGKFVGYETDFNTMKRQITDALKLNENVIIGYTQVDNTNTIINGHEITITSVKADRNGKLIFVCNDTDDNVSRPIEYSEDYLLPKIHHAALPQSVVANDVNFTESWVEGLNNYKQLKNQQNQQNYAA